MTAAGLGKNVPHTTFYKPSFVGLAIKNGLQLYNASGDGQITVDGHLYNITRDSYTNKISVTRADISEKVVVRFAQSVKDFFSRGMSLKSRASRLAHLLTLRPDQISSQSLAKLNKLDQDLSLLNIVAGREILDPITSEDEVYNFLSTSDREGEDDLAMPKSKADINTLVHNPPSTLFLAGFNLSEVNFQDAVLKEHLTKNDFFKNNDLSGANLRGADLSGYDLRGCNFIGADLRDVTFVDAKLERIEHDTTTLADANFLQAIKAPKNPAI